MICLELFWTFLKIGLFTIGGGHAMIPLIHDEVIGNGWMSSLHFWEFFAVSEATPGVVALKLATFVGFEQAGIVGAMAAVFGMVLPAFVIIILIAKVFKSFGKNKHVKNIFWGLKSVVVALVLSAAVMLLTKAVFPEVSLNKHVFDFDTNRNLWGILIFAVAFAVGQIRTKKKAVHLLDGETNVKRVSIHPIILIGLSAALGVILYVAVP